MCFSISWLDINMADFLVLLTSREAGEGLTYQEVTQQQMQL